MGTSRHNHSRSSAKSDRPLVAFDFDGTLTVRDSFMAFLGWRTPRLRFVSGLLRLAPAMAEYALDRDRERLKTAAVAVWLKGVSRNRLEGDAEAFAEAVWARFMRPDALAKWSEWGSKGALRVIVTATPEDIVAPFARRLGADRLIGTRLAVDREGRVTGAFETRNCRGSQKVVRLREAFGDRVALAAAYGDSSGDREMLELAQEKGLRVFRGRPCGVRRL